LATNTILYNIHDYIYADAEFPIVPSSSSTLEEPVTSCSPVVKVLVYHSSGPGFDSWYVSFRVRYYKGKNPNDAASTYQVFVNYILMTE
jgi:hypothetical protein